MIETTRRNLLKQVAALGLGTIASDKFWVCSGDMYAYLEKFFRTHVGEYASFADGGQRRRSRMSRVLSSENLFGTYSNGSFESGERSGLMLIARQIGDVLPDD